MKTTIIQHQQGSDAWHQHRANHLNASDCSAVMGLSSYKTRSQLLHEKATGITPEIDAQTQKRFDRGHEFEATARPWAEELLGDNDLFPVVLAGEFEGLKLSASLDGLTMDRPGISFEHKTGRADLLASLEQGVIPDEYHPQMEMGLMLSGAEKCLFMASSGDKDAMRWAWYLPNLELRSNIIAAWHQFAADLATYTPTEATVKPAGRTPETLPALHIEVNGMVTASNLAEFKAHALTVFGSINRELITDAQFADAEKTVKWCSEIESRLAAAKQHALSQTASIDQLFKAIDDISAEARAVRLELDKLVKARKDTIRAEAVLDGRNALQDHVAALTQRIGKPLMPAIDYDFSGVIKGKRSIDSMRDAIAVELARCKIEANTVADRITINLRTLNEKPELAFLFADVAQLVLKAPDDLAAVVQNRISAHQAAEAARVEAERARIAIEERAKAEAAERQRADAEIAAATAKARAEAHAQASADAAAKRASDEAIAKARQFEELEQSEIKRLADLNSAMIVQVDALNQPTAQAAIAPVAINVEPIALEVLGPPTLKLGAIADRLGFQLTANFLDSLGFKPAAADGRALLFQEQDFIRICNSLIRHIKSVSQVVAA